MDYPKPVSDKVEKLIETIQKDHDDMMTKKYPHVSLDLVSAKGGNKYLKIDIGNSGRYMVEMNTEKIYGIKAYGVIHRGYYYGTLDTIDEYYWGEYRAVKKIKLDAIRV